MIWNNYQPAELGWWIHLLLTRAKNTASREDVREARKYYNALGVVIQEAEKELDK